jgi:hypothetical protein
MHGVVDTSTLQVINRLPGQGLRFFEVTEHLAHQGSFFQLVRFDEQLSRGGFRGGSRRSTDQGGRFHQSFMLIAFVHQLDKLDLITRASRAVAAKAAERICLGIDLQAGRLVRVEGA